MQNIMDIQTIIVMVMGLNICPSDSLNLTIQLQKFVGPELYIFKGGRGYLGCFADYVGNDLELEWYSNGEKLTEAELNGKTLEIFIQALEFQQRSYTCMGKVKGKVIAKESTTVTAVGEQRNDVVILSSHQSNIIKENTGPITITCRTGVRLVEIFTNPIQLSHNYNVLYRNGVRQRAAKMYDIVFMGFSGFAFNNIYTAVTFNDPKQLVGTVKCSRARTDEQTITFTDKDGRKIGSLTTVSGNVEGEGKALRLLPAGKYVITCTPIAGYPEPSVNLTENGVPVTIQKHGTSYQATVTLTATGDELECLAKVDGFNKHVLKFNLNVSEVLDGMGQKLPSGWDKGWYFGFDSSPAI